MANIDLATPPAGMGPTLIQASGIRTSLGIPAFITITPANYAALVSADATDSNTIYIVQE